MKKIIKKVIKRVSKVAQTVSDSAVQVIDTGRNVKLVVNGRVKRVFRNMEDYNKNK